MSKRSSWRRSIRPRGHERLRKYMIGHSKQDPLQSPWAKSHRGRLGGRVSPLGASILRRAQYPLAFRSVPMNVPLRKVFGHGGGGEGGGGSPGGGQGLSPGAPPPRGPPAPPRPPLPLSRA